MKTQRALAFLVAGSALCGPAAGGEAVAWISLPAGSFMMGSESGNPSEKPVHRVELKAFELAKTEVTNAQYEACVKAKACSPAHDSDGTCVIVKGDAPEREERSLGSHSHNRLGGGFERGVLPDKFRGPDQPAVCVDWDQAAAFSRWVGGRLPSEAEWEYAARSGGRDWSYPWGDQEAACDRAVLIGDDGKSYGCGRDATWPVCSKPLGDTAQGLCDMAGNASEWVQDWVHESYDGAPADGSAWETPPGARRAARSGSWRYGAAFARAANRCDPGYPSFAFLGFRPARSAGGAARGPAARKQTRKAPAGPAASDIDSLPDFQPRARPRARAVVIGARADFAAGDARLVSAYLTKVLGLSRDNVSVLIDERATLRGLEEAFQRWLPGRVGKGDEVVVYFAGLSSGGGLVLHDGDPAGYPLARVYSQLGSLAAGKVTVVLDCPFPGTAAEVPPPNVTVLSAAAAGQLRRTYQDKGHGLFTYFLLRDLRRRAAEDGIGFETVFDEAAAQVSQTARREYNADQTPRRLSARP